MYKPIGAYGVAALVALTLAACAPSQRVQPNTATITPTAHSGASDVTQVHDDFAYGSAEVTVREGLKNISQRYIEPVDINVLALGGLRGLATIDPNLRVTLDKANQELGLYRGTTAITRLPAPDPLDAAAWAKLSSDTLRFMRPFSEDLRSANNEAIYQAIFDGMLSSLDTFSRYASAQEAQVNRANRDGFGGIGVRFTRVEESILVTHVSNNSPALDGGVKPGDVIVQIDDTNLTDLKLRDVAKLLRGPVGSYLTMTVLRLGNSIDAPERTIDFSLQREHIVAETVRTRLDDNLLVMSISSFNKNTASSVHDVLRAHDQAMRDGSVEGIVLDLRGNPGGLLSQSVNVADLFLNEGNIISTRGRHPDSIHVYRAGGIDLARNLPLAILVDGDSASAAEIVASALQDLGRAVVIGSASYGKGTVQTVIRLPNDGEVTLTWSRFVSPSGYAIHGLGVMPAVCASDTVTPAMATPEDLYDAILAPEHIDRARPALDAWRAAGMIFDGRRRTLRTACPAKSFKPGQGRDLLMSLAQRVLHDAPLYQRALLLSRPEATASR